MLVFLVLVCVPVLFPLVSGDGCLLIPSVDRWVRQPEEKQIGIINYHDGYEKLILVIDVKNSSLSGDSAAWIFPVPSDPTQVNIDVIDEIPRMMGGNVEEEAKDALNTPYSYLYLTQLYTIPYVLYMMITTMEPTGGEYGDQYTIYSHIEKKGLTTETVSAKDALGFQTYLLAHNLSLPVEANTTVQEYIGQDYCFVVSWISDLETFKKEAIIDEYSYYYNYGEPYFMLGVSIDFPTERIYYPLKLTSVYGTKTIPILLQVLGYVTPESNLDISNEGLLQTSYLRGSYWVPQNLTTFFAEQIEQEKSSMDSRGGHLLNSLQYTEIQLVTQARYLTEDLWIKDEAPAQIATDDFIISNGWVLLLIFFIIASCLASLIAGLVVYYKQKPSLYKFTLLGLSNLTSIIGFFIASFALHIDQTFVKKPLEKKTTDTKIPKKRIGIGVLLAFIILVIAASILLLPTYSYGDFLYRFHSYILSVLIAILLVGPIIGIVAAFVYGGYKDKQKTVFILLFSTLFIVLLIIFQRIIQATM